MLAGTGCGIDEVQLKDILNPEESKEKRSEILRSLLNDKNKLIDHRVMFGRNLLHLAIIRNDHTLTILLILYYPELLTLRDKWGQTPLHFMVGKNYQEDILNLVFPNAANKPVLVPNYQAFINLRDGKGRTLVYHAVLENRLQAVQQLIALGANPYIADSKGVNPYALAQHNHELLFALRIIITDADSIEKAFPAKTHRQIDSEALNTLVKEFSLLNIAGNIHLSSHRPRAIITERSSPSSSSPSGSSSSGSLPSSSSPSSSSEIMYTARDVIPLTASSSNSSTGEPFTPRSDGAPIHVEQRTETLREIIQNGDLQGLKGYLEQGGDLKKRILGRSLIISVFLAATKSGEMQIQRKEKNSSIQMSVDEEIDYSTRYQQQLEQLVLLLKHTRVDHKNKHGHGLINYIDGQNSVHITILQYALKKLSEQVKGMAKYHNARLRQLEEQYEARLYQAGITEFPVVPVTLEPVDVPLRGLHDNEHFTTLLWQLCTAVVKDLPERKFNNLYISNMLQATLTLASAEEALAVINALWPYFDGNQKLVAHFVVKELLIWDVHHELCRNDNFSQEILRLQERMQKDFPAHGRALNAFLKEILTIKSAALHNFSHVNYQVISAWLVLPRFAKHTPSLEEWIISGSQKRGEEQREILCLVAHEFSAVMSLKMRTIRINEFYNKAWSRDDNQYKAPNIYAQTHATNTLIEFIQELILNATSPEEVTNRLRFFILLAAQLCSVKNQLGPDMASVIIIVGALNTNTVSRLKANFQSLEPEVQAIWTKLNDLTSNRANYKWLRAIESAYSCPIPHLGIILADITFSYDGNTMENGNTFMNVALILGPKLKKILQLQRQLLQTPSYLQTNIRFIARKNRELSEDDMYDKSYQFSSPRVDISELSFDELLKEVNTSIAKNILPRYVLNGVEYSQQNALKVVLFRVGYFIAQMSPKLRKPAILSAKNLALSLCELINVKCPSTIVNYHDYCKQLDAVFREDKLAIKEYQKLINEVSTSLSAESILNYTYNNVEYAANESIKGVFLKMKELIEQMAPGTRKTTLLPEQKLPLSPGQELLLSLTNVINLQDKSNKVNYLYYHEQFMKLHSSPLMTPALQRWQQTLSSTQVAENSEGKRKLKLPFQSLF